MMWPRTIVAALALWLASFLLLHAAGCSRTKENLEKRGIEFKSGKVMRVFRF